MALKMVFDAYEDVPESLREHYTERDGKFEIVVEGMKTQADVDRVGEALRKERSDHAVARDRFKPWEGLEIEDVRAKLDRYPELEQAAEGKLDEEKLNGIVEGRLKGRLAPVERERDTLRGTVAERDAAIVKLESFASRRRLQDIIREKIAAAKCDPRAVPDILLNAESMFEETEDGRFITKDGVGVTPAVEAETWLTDMQAKRGHWWPASQGGGAPGSTGATGFSSNPWTNDSWNVTEQMRVVRELGIDKARQMAKAAGVDMDKPVRPKPLAPKA